MKTQEEIEQLSEKDFNNRQSVGHYELADLKSRDYYCDGFSNGYNQCQEDMADKKYTEEDMIAFAYQFSSINVTDFRKHLRDFDINIKEKNKI